VEGFHLSQHLEAIYGFADDLNVVLLPQESAEPFSEDAMCVSDEYADRVYTAQLSPFPTREHSPDWPAATTLCRAMPQ
jgi:hypothetical protein